MSYYKYFYKVGIRRASLPLLQALADDLAFVATEPGAMQNKPSPAMLLDALAAAYANDPAVVVAALRDLGVVCTQTTDQ